MSETAVIEYMALGWVVLLTAVAPRWTRVLYVRCMWALGRVAARPRLTMLLLGTGTAATAAALAYFVHWPQPSAHDEFAYLLGAETFAGGELTRPTPPTWEHFETFHVLMEPSYAPKYPPGQSLMLALGMVLTGQIRASLWISVGAMIAAMFWMLAQWVPRRFALLGAILLAMHLGIRGPWVQTFYGGAVAATGGALMVGAVPGILARRSTLAALTLAAGLVMVGLTRPFEGLMASLPVAVLLLAAWLRAPRGQGLRFAVRVALPIAVVIGALVGWLALHNAAVTGSPTTLPYAEYDARYSIYPPFIFQEAAPAPHYRHEVLESFMLHFQRGEHGIELGMPLVEMLLSRYWQLLGGLLGPILRGLLVTCTLLTLIPRLRRRYSPSGSRSVALPAAVLLSAAIGASFTTYAAPHYAAPGAGALMVVLMALWRRVLASPGQGRRWGAAATVAIVLALTGITAERASKRWLGGGRDLGEVRANVNAGLLSKPGLDLVLVRTGPEASVHQEFVYNVADIDQAEIVWARDLGEERNTELLEHFHGRNIWRMTVESLEAKRWTLERVGEEFDAPESAPSAPRWGTW